MTDEKREPRVDADGYLPPEDWDCGGDPNCPTCRALDQAERAAGRKPPASRRGLLREEDR